MRVHVDDLPRIESTSTSSTASRPAISECFFFHLSKPARAARLSGEFATTMSGIFTRGFFAADFARDGATREASPFTLRKCGGQGASPRPAASSFSASFKQLLERAGSGVYVGVRIADLSRSAPAS